MLITLISLGLLARTVICCSLVFLRFDQANQVHVFLDFDNGGLLPQIDECSQLLARAKIEHLGFPFEGRHAIFQWKDNRHLVLIDEGTPVSEKGWARMPVGKTEIDSKKFNQMATLCALNLELDKHTIKVFRGELKNVTPIPLLELQTPPILPFTGLPNEKQVLCYMNSALQLLIRIPEWRQFVSKAAEEFPHNQMIMYLETILRNMEQGEAVKSETLTNLISEMASEVQYMRNSDGILTLVGSYDWIERLLTLLNRITRKNLLLPSHFTPLFHLRTKNVDSDTPGMVLLDIGVEPVLAHEGQQAIEGEVIQINQLANSFLPGVEYLPPYLFLSLSRYADGKRILNPVQFPLDSWTHKLENGHSFSIGDYLKLRLENSLIFYYRLYSLILHVPSVEGCNNGGHYVALVHDDKSKRWVLLDDDKPVEYVVLQEQLERIQAQATLLLYRRIDHQFVKNSFKPKVNQPDCLSRSELIGRDSVLDAPQGQGARQRDGCLANVPQPIVPRRPSLAEQIQRLMQRLWDPRLAFTMLIALGASLLYRYSDNLPSFSRYFDDWWSTDRRIVENE